MRTGGGRVWELGGSRKKSAEQRGVSVGRTVTLDLDGLYRRDAPAGGRTIQRAAGALPPVSTEPSSQGSRAHFPNLLLE